MSEYIYEITQDYPDIPFESDEYSGTVERRAERTCRMKKDDRYSEMYEGPMLRCTRCDAPVPEIFTGQYNYCPNCGAKVIGETE